MRPKSIVAVAAARADHPDHPLWKPLCEFLDEFYEAAQESREGMICDEPLAAISREELAYFAGCAEYLADVYNIAKPDWLNGEKYFLTTPYYPQKLGPMLEALCAAESPIQFRRRLVFTEGRPLRRKLGPNPTLVDSLGNPYLLNEDDLIALTRRILSPEDADIVVEEIEMNRDNWQLRMVGS